MARLRITLPGGGCHHCVSRVVDRRFIFGEEEIGVFVATLRRLEAFLDVRVLTYCVMSNHFHLLLEVPGPDEVTRLTAQSLRERLPLLYHGQALVGVRAEIDSALDAAAKPGGSKAWADAITARYQARMGNLSTFLKELKWRFSKWFNGKNDRVGALWEDRFRSVLVQGSKNALMTIAAYIDLNPVRAGMVEDPKDYRWCGYGEAVAGKKIARKNLSLMHLRTGAWQAEANAGDREDTTRTLPSSGGKHTPTVSVARITWKQLGPAYRMYLFGQGQRRLGHGQTGRGAKPGISPTNVREVIDVEGDRLPPRVIASTPPPSPAAIRQLQRHRVRHFTEGTVFGSADFVEQVFESHRELFGKGRKSGARKIRSADFGDLEVLRDLRD